MITEEMKKRIKDIYKNNPDNYYFMGTFEELTGKTIIEIDGAKAESEHVFIKCSDNSVYVMYHVQDCCEFLYIGKEG